MWWLPLLPFSLMKFLLYIIGLRRTSGSKSGEFIYSDKHQKFIYQGRELDADEFNVLMAKQWPLQRMANQQVSGFAFVPDETETVETPKPAFFEFPLTDEPVAEPCSEPVPDELPAEETPETEKPATEESPADEPAPVTDEAPKSTRTKKNK